MTNVSRIAVLLVVIAAGLGCDPGPVDNHTTLYVFTSRHCGDCIADRSVVDAIITSGRVRVVVTDFQDRPDLAAWFGVKRVPAYILAVVQKDVVVTIWRTNSAREAQARL
jgi:thiol-disulfide isomerase/thioredoxin